MGNLQELLVLAKSQTGYQEKKSAALLDSFDGNAGYGNYTKYSRDVTNWGLAGCQGQPWCATYQFWLEGMTFGVDMALKHFCMDRKTYQGYNCFCIYEAFEKAGRTSSDPEPGCLVVFHHSHIGRVIRIQNNRIYTNEGNTSALYGDSNGGTVKEKDYAMTDPNIRGYCLIDDKDIGKIPFGTEPQDAENDITAVRVEAFQRWLNTWYPKLLNRWGGGLLEEDGSFGPKTKAAAVIVWEDILNRLYGCSLSLGNTGFNSACRESASKAVIKNGDTGTLPAIAEGFSAAKGYYRGNIDAIFGNRMEEAVRNFQKAEGLVPDGVIGRDTWSRIFR